MKKLAMTTAVLLVCAAWTLAQEKYPSGQTATSASSSGQTTVQGCLERSGANYTLTDKSGTKYQLTGDTAKLSEHAGHEVEITGTPSGASAGASASSTGASASAEQTLDVSNLRHIAETCSATSKSEQSTPSPERPPMSEKPPIR